MWQGRPSALVFTDRFYRPILPTIRPLASQSMILTVPSPQDVALADLKMSAFAVGLTFAIVALLALLATASVRLSFATPKAAKRMRPARPSLAIDPAQQDKVDALASEAADIARQGDDLDRQAFESWRQGYRQRQAEITRYL